MHLWVQLQIQERETPQPAGPSKKPCCLWVNSTWMRPLTLNSRLVLQFPSHSCLQDKLKNLVYFMLSWYLRMASLMPPEFSLFAVIRILGSLVQQCRSKKASHLPPDCSSSQMPEKVTLETMNLVWCCLMQGPPFVVSRYRLQLVPLECKVVCQNLAC